MKNIVWLASYPKSGNTWFRMFLSNYMSNKDEPATLDDISRTPIASSAPDFEDEIGFNPFEMYGDEVDLYRPELCRILSSYHKDETQPLFKKIHDAYTQNKAGEDLFPGEVSKAAIYFVRNPLDVCISFANHSASEVENTLKNIGNPNFTLAGKRTGQLRQKLLSWSEHVLSWTEQTSVPVIVLRYEDMLSKPFETFSAAIRFAGLPDDEERIKKAIEFANFENLKKHEKEAGFNEKMQGCKSFFWKGKAGYYREYLSEEQINQVIASEGKVMQAYGYLDNNLQLTV